MSARGASARRELLRVLRSSVRTRTTLAVGRPNYGAHAEPHALDACTRRVHKDNEEVARDKHKE
jgi:hypothetical protein